MEQQTRPVSELIAATNLNPEPFINISEALTLMPGMTRNHLAQLRFDGTGPRFYKPTGRTVFYKTSEVLAWMNRSAETSTARIAR